MPQDLTLVLMAAGMGSRYGGLKQVEPMGPAGESLVDYAVYDAKRAGFEQIVFIIRRDIERDFKETVLARLAKGGFEASYVFQELEDVPTGVAADFSQRTKPWGTAHAVWSARQAVKTPFAVLNADDYYGPAAYRLLADHLRQGSEEYAIVGYNLADTLSVHGTVARGILEQDPSGRLIRIAERTQIERLASGHVVNREPVGEDLEIAPDANVSMNIMGFTPGVFLQLGTALDTFLQNHGQEAKSELYLPNVVGALVTAGQAVVKVLPSGDEWFGVTYAADTDVVKARLRDLHAAGVYPRDGLWTSVSE